MKNYDYFNKHIIVGYGNIGKHIEKEFLSIKEEFDIYDKYQLEHSFATSRTYQIAFICVPTELIDNKKGLDISAVEDAIETVRASVYVIKSTVPVGTCEMLKNKYQKNIVHSAEYYGTTKDSSESPDWLLLGGSKKDCSRVAELYQRVKSGKFRIKFTDTKTSELAKFMENCFLALKVTFCAEFFDIAQKFGISYPELREIFIMDERMGDSHTYINPNQPYYTSHCLNKDPNGLMAQAKELSPLINKMIEINKNKKMGNL